MNQGGEHEPGRATSRVSSKGQVMLPLEIREALGIRRGDVLAFRADGQEAVITKVAPLDTGWHRALQNTLEEWHSPEDEEAFRDL